jgi:hypothetical protein
MLFIALAACTWHKVTTKEHNMFGVGGAADTFYVLVEERTYERMEAVEEDLGNMPKQSKVLVGIETAIVRCDVGKGATACAPVLTPAQAGLALHGPQTFVTRSAVDMSTPSATPPVEPTVGSDDPEPANRRCRELAALIDARKSAGILVPDLPPECQ